MGANFDGLFVGHLGGGFVSTFLVETGQMYLIETTDRPTWILAFVQKPRSWNHASKFQDLRSHEQNAEWMS